MNLFAITNRSDPRIVRFPLSQALQNQISDLFAEQASMFAVLYPNVIAFDGRYSPSEDESFEIDGFDDPFGLQNIVVNVIGVEQFNPAHHSFSDLRAVFAIQETGGGKHRILIQSFDQRRILSAAGRFSITFSGNTFHRMNETGLTLDTRLLAILEDGVLRFQSFSLLKRVFDLAKYFRDATDQEVRDFAGHASLQVADVDVFIAAVGPLLRRKIAAIDQSGILDKVPAADIVAVAISFNLEVQTSIDGKIILPVDKYELRKLLSFLDEDYYESPLSHTHYISNSKRVAP